MRISGEATLRKPYRMTKTERELREALRFLLALYDKYKRGALTKGQDAARLRELRAYFRDDSTD